MGSPTIDLSAGMVPSPRAGGIDLSAGLVPRSGSPPAPITTGPSSVGAQAQVPSLTANPNGEGTYKMNTPNGQIGVPFSNVAKAQQQGLSLDSSDLQRFAKDYAAAPHAGGIAGNWAYNTRTVPADGSQTGGSTVGAFLQNLGGSAAQTLAQPFLHPINTVAGEAKQAIQTSIPGMAYYAAKGQVNPAVQGVEDTVNNVVSNPGQAVPQLLGQASGTALLGGALEPLARIGAPIAKAVVGGPSAVKLAATRLLVDGTPGDLLARALKPTSSYGAGTPDMFDQPLGPILNENPKISGVSDFASATDAARDTAFGQHNDLIAPYRQPLGFNTVTGDKLPGVAVGPVRPSSINGAPIADAQMDSVPLMDRIEQPPTFNPGKAGTARVITVNSTDSSPLRLGATVGATPPSWDGGILNKTAAIADNYRTNFDVPTLDMLRENANAKLNAFYNKAGGDQAAALSNPETARIKAVGDASRQLLYPVLEQNAGLDTGSVAANQQMYGKLADVSDIANKRDTVFARQDPVSLAQQIASGHGGPLDRIGNFFVNKALKGVTDSDALVRSAIDRYLQPVTVRPRVVVPPILQNPTVANPSPLD